MQPKLHSTHTTRLFWLCSRMVVWSICIRCLDILSSLLSGCQASSCFLSLTRGEKHEGATNKQKKYKPRESVKEDSKTVNKTHQIHPNPANMETQWNAFEGFWRPKSKPAFHPRVPKHQQWKRCDHETEISEKRRQGKAGSEGLDVSSCFTTLGLVWKAKDASESKSRVLSTAAAETATAVGRKGKTWRKGKGVQHCAIQHRSRALTTVLCAPMNP